MAYWPFDPPEMISAWVALDDTSMENGCVRFFAGSHKLGLLPHASSNVKGNSLGLVDHPAVDALPEHAIEVKRGSVVLHHALTVHHSQPNQSNRSRRGLVYVYMSPKVKLVQPERMQGPAVFPEVECCDKPWTCQEPWRTHSHLTTRFEHPVTFANYEATWRSSFLAFTTRHPRLLLMATPGAGLSRIDEETA